MYRLTVRANCIAILFNGKIHETFDHSEMSIAIRTLRNLKR